MKIIAKASTNVWIAEVTDGELAKVSGFSVAYGRDWSEYLLSIGVREERALVGAVFPVSGWWERVETIRQRETELKRLSETLGSLGKLIADAWPAVTLPLNDVVRSND